MLTAEDRKRRRTRKLNDLRRQLFAAIDAVLDPHDVATFVTGCEGAATCRECALRALADEYRTNTRTGPGYGRRRRAGRVRR